MSKVSGVWVHTEISINIVRSVLIYRIQLPADNPPECSIDAHHGLREDFEVSARLYPSLRLARLLLDPSKMDRRRHLISSRQGGSPYSPPVPAAETPQVVLVTGANSGTGYQTALSMYRAGATVVLACRSKAKADVAIDAIKAGKDAAAGVGRFVDVKRQRPAAVGGGKLMFVECDLTDLESVKRCAEEVIQ